MVQYLYDKNIIIYTFGVLGGLGFLLRLIVNLVYKHLVKESDRLGETKNKKLQHMKLKFSTCYKLKIGVNNVDTFVDKNVLKYRFCGILLSTWDNLCGLVLFVSLLIVPIITVFGVAFECGQDQIMLAGAVGISVCALLIIVDKFINLSSKKKMLRLNLMDYLENFCKVRLEQEALHPELVEQYRKEYFQNMEEDQTNTAATIEKKKDEPKDELNRRREARRKKEEERKLLAAKREEEHRKAEEARKEEERRKQEERKLLAARRREEERQKLEEERQALEARRAELKRRAEEKLIITDQKRLSTEYQDRKPLKVEEVALPEKQIVLNAVMEGLEETAADIDHGSVEAPVRAKEMMTKESKQKALSKTAKTTTVNQQEAKLIEDVLKEFFA